MKLTEHPLGTLIETNSWIALLGNRQAQIESLRTAFPTLQFKRIKQVHGDRVVHTSPHSIDFSNEADGHFTSEKGLALCIATADCIPIVIVHSRPDWVACVHAGWRGVEKQIFKKTVSNLIRHGCKAENLHVLVGPHIQKTSFEVGIDVRDQLLKSFHGDQSMVSTDISNEKAKVDLAEILKTQLVESGLSLENAFFEMKDTVTDLGYHSFRRDRENSGRQLSFVALKP